ncbi:putative ribonuclease H-like domain-containing protein [Tanacetum coccineum]|uniref:Ribonuclease H-like domain-containing protein n=1 Tax=Tanacetum coccineum TaxID=301880 RepID=A0ABQ5BK17_9ASTR
MDILKNTNFFRAFTASANVPSIYVQQFWNTLAKDTKTDSAHHFMPPPVVDLVIDFVNNLGYPKELQFVSKMYMNSLYQPWRTILFMINQCLTGKTSGGDRPRHPVLQMLWGVVTGTNVNYAELIWEEFIQAIKNFFSDMANLKVPTKKPKPLVILYHRFTKLIIYYLGSRHNIHRRPQSPIHITADDYPLNNLKFISKEGVDEVFGMPIPKDLITNAIQNSEYYKKYLEMAARKPRQPTTMTGEEVEKKKKALKADEEPQPASKLQVEDDEYNLQRGIQMSLESLQAPIGRVVIREPDPGFIRKLPDVEGNGKVTQDASTGPSAQPQDDTSANVVHDTSSPADSTNDAEAVADMEQSNNEMDTEILNVAGSDPGKTPESRTLPERELMEEDQAESDPGKSHVAQAGPNPEPMHEDFIATVCPKVHERLKLTIEEQVHIENPPNSSGTLSSMKNLQNAFTFGDQFLNDKSTEEEPGKANVETEVESMVTVPIHQAFSSVPPLSTPIIDLSPPKPVTTDPDLATRVSALEKRSADFEQKNKLQDKKTQALASRVYKLEHHDLYSMIDKQVNEVVKEAVHNALQAPLCERFRDSSEFQMKEILHDRMFESNSYRLHLDHTTLYEALECWDLKLSHLVLPREEFILPSLVSIARVEDSTARRKLVLTGSTSGIRARFRSRVRSWDLFKRDSGCSRHMTGNKSFLTDYQEIDGGFVAFGGSPKGGKITRKGKIRTGKLDFEDVYFVKELKFNLFSVSQMCDKKNNVLFTETECLVLSPDFKLLDESQVLLKVPRQNNMYSFDLKNVVPSGGLTCLFAKARIDESNLWHRKLGHINFKTMNKLVRGNLVRGLPSKLFENNHTCVSCQKGKQDKASCKTKTMKVIKREFSVSRTPQQNGVAKRKNRTLIEATRTMLADSLLPTIIWAEAINTACYVQNRVLLSKPHNKIPYELLIGRPPNLDFIRPFGCPVTILNTLDHLGKFEGKADEGFLVGYTVNRSGLEWLFDIDSLTKSLSYEPVTAGNQTNGDADDKDTDEVPGKGDDGANKVSGSDDQETTDSSTQDVNAVGPKTGIFNRAYDDVGAEDDLNNLETTMNVSPIPTTRIHKDHPKDQIIGDPNLGTQTRRMNKFSQEHAMKVIQALTDPRWIEAMQDELLQFRLQKVWRLVDLPKGKHAIRIKWVYRNKKDERGIVVRNKARLVVQGYTQEEGIDYDEVFAPVAKIEAIRLFLAYASFMRFIVYQIDVKSAFLYSIIEEEVYVCQPPSFEDPQFLDKVYKVEKALYGLHQAPRVWNETLSTYLLENGFRRGIIDKTLFIKKDKCDILLVQVYVDDIIFGSTKKSLCTEFKDLMHKKFQMSSMGELTFFLGLNLISLQVKKNNHSNRTTRHCIRIKKLRCGARFQVTPYSLTSSCYSDYAGASLDRKSTTGGCQFLGKRLISWQCKKQTIVANSTTEAEYVVAANCCG